ncbi:MAG: hypothetical protein E7331_03905 [Clostridiales bacterium]|nr:hypothetical protein [Clostridiales bacterium]
MSFWQWIGLALAAAVLCMVVRCWRPEMAGLCTVAAGCILLLAAVEHVETLREYLERIVNLAGLKESYISTLVKTLGIGYVTEIARQTCEDLGEKGLGDKVAMGGKLTIFALAAPLLAELLETILQLVP